MKINKYRFINKKIYVRVDGNEFADETVLLDAIGKALKEGGNIIELKTNNSAPNKVVALGKRIRELTSFFDAMFLIQSRVDIAQITHADGVLLEKYDISPSEVRALTHENFIIGQVVDSIDEISSETDFIINDEKFDGEIQVPVFSKGGEYKVIELNPKYLEY